MPPGTLVVLNGASSAGKSSLLKARQHFGVVHAHGVYDLTVDTHTHSTAECAAQIVAYLASGAPPRAFRQLRG